MSSKDAKKSQEEARLQQLKQEMRKGTFEGKASEAAQQSINKLKNNNENLKQKFETLLNTLKING